MKRTGLAKRSSKSSDTSIKEHARTQRPDLRFALCLTESEPDLELGKVYQALPDPAAAEDQYVRIVDESGEDYLYPEQYFTFLELPEKAKTALAIAANAR
jgi:hypothetical protein